MEHRWLELGSSGLIDKFMIVLSPVLFGSSIRRFDGVEQTAWPWNRSV